MMQEHLLGELGIYIYIYICSHAFECHIHYVTTYKSCNYKNFEILEQTKLLYWTFVFHASFPSWAQHLLLLSLPRLRRRCWPLRSRIWEVWLPMRNKIGLVFLVPRCLVVQRIRASGSPWLVRFLSSPSGDAMAIGHPSELGLSASTRHTVCSLRRQLKSLS
jgi:hypothetical protein